MLGLYIHIPFCVQKCKYCDFNSYKIEKDKKEKFLNDLKKEMSLYTNKDRKINTIFFGGGTPSILSNTEMKMIMDEINKNFCIDKDAEISMECNPGTLNKEKLEFMKSLGINRLSIGLQAVQEDLLGYIGRIHNYEQFEKNYIEARKAGFKNINIDLMYNLPHQTFEDWKETLDKIIELNPEHISAYSLILEEGTILKYQNYQPLDDEQEYQWNLLIDEKLQELGFDKYEISNYAKKGYESKHNLVYWRFENYYGIGLGSCGKNNHQIIEHSRSLTKYLNGDFKTTTIEQSKEEMMFDQVMMSLRLVEGLNLEVFKERYQEDALEIYQDAIDKNKKEGRLVIENNFLKATKEGLYVLNDILVDFMK